MAQRDAEATKQAILDAVGRVLARDGFSGLGINAIAKEAGRQVLQFDSREPLRYNKENLLNPFFIVE